MVIANIVYLNFASRLLQVPLFGQLNKIETHNGLKERCLFRTSRLLQVPLFGQLNKIETHNGLKERCLFRTEHNTRIVGVSPLFKLQNNS